MADREQTSLAGLHKTVTKNYVHTRATQREISGKHEFGASTNISTFRFFMRLQSDDYAYVQLSAANQPTQIDLDTDNEFTILLLDDDTRGLDLGDYDYGVEIVGTDGAEQAPLVGVITLTDEIVYDSDEAWELSYTTKSTYDSLIDGLLECNIATTLAVDADATDGTITVTAIPTGLAAADDITIADGTNAETHTIAAGGISGTVITLDATTLANDYTADKTVVVKVF